MSEKDEETYDLAFMLAYARKVRGIGRQQVADRIGVTRGTISDYESGRRQPSLEILAEIAKCYQVTTDYLLGIEINNNSALELHEA